MDTSSNSPRKPLEVVLLSSPDLADLETEQPADPTDFSLVVQILVGVAGEEGADTFDLLVCSPNRLASHVPTGGALSGRGFLFMARYDYALLRRTIEGWCELAAACDWLQAASILARYARWELEQERDAEA